MRRLLAIVGVIAGTAMCVSCDGDFEEHGFPHGGGYEGEGEFDEQNGNPFVPSDLIMAETPPAPIQGGTLHRVLHTPDELELAVAADPDRDQLFIIDVDTDEVATIALEPGDQPGRITETSDGVVHVALRGGNAVISIDPITAQILSRAPVCVTPNGITADATDTVHVACSTGELRSWHVGGASPPRVVQLGGDLRDVAAYEGRLFVSRMRSAEILVLDEEAELVFIRRPGWEMVDEIPSAAMREPHVAWRLKATPGRGVHVLYQLHTNRALPGSGGYYGGDCAGVSLPALTRVDRNERGPTSLLQGTMVADFDFALVGDTFATVAIGNTFDEGGSLPDIQHYAHDGLVFAQCREPSKSADFLGAYEVTSAVFAGDDALWIQSRQPAALIVRTRHGGEKVIALSEESRRDTGLAFFHANLGGGSACVTCHPLAQDDGHVWKFDDALRRTQSLAGTIADTAPYHWTGEAEDLDALIYLTLTTRMFGPALDEPRTNVFARWLSTVPAPAKVAATDASERGRLLFEDSEVGCSDCHAGPQFTRDGDYAVGTGAAFQTPSLLGLRLRAPYMHDGCAKTLEERFDPACGGESHGKVEHLSAGQRDDLVAYLMTL